MEPIVQKSQPQKALIIDRRHASKRAEVFRLTEIKHRSSSEVKSVDLLYRDYC